MEPGSPRRPPQAQYAAPRSPNKNAHYPGGVPDPRYRPRPLPQPHPPPLSALDTSGTYYGEDATADIDSEHWPLPPRAAGQAPPRSNSPLGHPPKRPWPLQQRPDYPPAKQSQPRPGFRPAPPGRPYPQGSSPTRSHHGNGQWHGDGYNTPHGPAHYHRGPQGRPPPGMNYQKRPPRPPGGSSSRRGPPDFHQHPSSSQHSPADGWGNNFYYSSARPLATLAPGRDSDATPVKIPSYYFEKPVDISASGSGAASVEGAEDSEAENNNDGDFVAIKSSQAEESTVEPAPLIRQASLGKKTRPMLTTVTNGERRRGSSVDGETNHPSQPSSSQQLTPFEEEADAMPGAWISEGPTPNDTDSQDKDLRNDSHVALTGAGAGFAIASEVNKQPNEEASNFRRSSGLLGPVPGLSKQSFSESETDLRQPSSDDRGITQTRGIVGTAPFSPLQQGDQDDIHTHDPVSPIEAQYPNTDIEGLTEQSEKRRKRPSNLDIEAVRDAEARGSMTSLPDLIRRATRLATNLDRGKTASRLGMNYFLNSSENDVNVEKYRAAINNRQSKASMSDMLNVGGKDERKSFGQFSSMLRHSQLPSDSDAAELQDKQNRKFLGLPPRILIVLGVLLFLLIAAAIVIPVVLFVVPKKHSHPKQNLTALERCTQQISCENKGVHIIGHAGACSCLCTNGYTGKTCTTHEQSGCTTTTVGSTRNATVGNNIPQLIADAQDTYQIPLDKEALLGLFSATALSCSSENALVAFNRAAKRSMPLAGDLTSNYEKRQPARSSKRASSSTSGGSGIEFAGVAVLYILQETGKLASANTAHQTLQSYFSGTDADANARNISLGNGFSCNLRQQNLVWTLDNGTTVANHDLTTR